MRAAWLGAQLTTIGYHDPRKFPKLDDLIAPERKPFNKAQWRAAIAMLTAGATKRVVAKRSA